MVAQHKLVPIGHNYLNLHILRLSLVASSLCILQLTSYASYSSRIWWIIDIGHFHFKSKNFIYISLKFISKQYNFIYLPKYFYFIIFSGVITYCNKLEVLINERDEILKMCSLQNKNICGGQENCIFFYLWNKRTRFNNSFITCICQKKNFFFLIYIYYSLYIKWKCNLFVKQCKKL